jgi:hypothetical protein
MNMRKIILILFLLCGAAWGQSVTPPTGIAWTLQPDNAGTPAYNGWYQDFYNPVLHLHMHMGQNPGGNGIYSKYMSGYNPSTNTWTGFGGYATAGDACEAETATEVGDGHPEGTIATDTNRNFAWTVNDLWANQSCNTTTWNTNGTTISWVGTGYNFPMPSWVGQQLAITSGNNQGNYAITAVTTSTGGACGYGSCTQLTVSTSAGVNTEVSGALVRPFVANYWNLTTTAGNVGWVSTTKSLTAAQIPDIASFETWRYDPDDDVLFMIGAYGGGMGMAVYCPTSGTGVLSANQTAVGCANPDDFTLIYSNNQSSSGVPHNTNSVKLVWMASVHKFLLFGGELQDGSTAVQGGWLYTPKGSSKGWAQSNSTLQPTNACFNLDCMDFLDYDSIGGGVFYHYAAATPSDYYYNPVTDQWAALTSSGGGPGTSASVGNTGTMVYNPYYDMLSAWACGESGGACGQENSPQVWTATITRSTTNATGQFRITESWPDGNAKWIKACGIIASYVTGTPATVTLTGPNSLSVPLTIQEALYSAGPAGVNRTNEPFCLGVPIPDSYAITSSNLAQLAFSGTSPVPNSNLASGSGPITVNTSAAIFTVKDTGNFNVLDTVTVGSTQLVTSGSSMGMVITGPSTTGTYPNNVTCGTGSGQSACTHLYASANDSASSCSIEENGPIMAGLRCIFTYKDASGNPYLHGTVRETFYYGETYARVSSILRNADWNSTTDATGNTFDTAAKGMQASEIRIALNPSVMSGTLNFTIGSNSGTQTGTLNQSGGTDQAYLYEGQTGHFTGGQQCGPSAGNQVSAYASCANGYTPDQGWEIVKSTTSNPNVVAATYTSGITLSGSGGASYSGTCSFSFSGGGGTGATGTLPIYTNSSGTVAGFVTGAAGIASFTITNAGSGYTSAPTSATPVSCSIPSGTATASGTATVSATLGNLLASGTSTVPAGWSDLDNSGGAGLEIASWLLGGFYPASLEYDAGGDDVRVGLYSARNSNPIYIGWTKWERRDAWLNFHASALSNPATSFMSFQAPLIGRAATTWYNQSGVLDTMLPTGTQETTFWYNAEQDANPAIDNANCTTSSCIADDAVPESWLGGVNWNGFAGGDLQNENGLKDLELWLKYGYTGRYLDAVNRYQMEGTQAMNHSDGTSSTDSTPNHFFWSSYPDLGTVIGYYGQPYGTIISANDTLSPQGAAGWGPSGGGYVYDCPDVVELNEHAWCNGLMDYYAMTGDESIHEMIESLKNAYNLPSSFVYKILDYQYLPYERSIANFVRNAMKLYEFLSATGDSTGAAAALTDAEEVFTVWITNPVCVTDKSGNNWPAGCTPYTSAETTGVGMSPVWGGFWAPQNYAGDYWCGQSAGPGGDLGGDYRIFQPFMQAMMVEALLKMAKDDPTYGKQAGDFAYGIAQFMDLMAFKDDTTGHWYSTPNNGAVNFHGTNATHLNNGMPEYWFLDEPGVCPAGTTAAEAAELSDGNYYDPTALSFGNESSSAAWSLLQMVNGSLSAEQLIRFQMYLQKGQDFNGSVTPTDIGDYSSGDVIARYDNPTGLTFQDVPFTVTTAAGGYNLTFTPPAGTCSQTAFPACLRIKYSTTATLNAGTGAAPNTVMWLGYNNLTGAWTYNPTTYVPWFWATDATPSSMPSGWPNSGLFTVLVSTTATGLTASNFSVRVMATGSPTCTISLSPASPGPYTVGQNPTIAASESSCSGSGWTMSGFPAGESINSSTGAITGALTTAGTSASATVSFGGTAGTPVSITVNAAPSITTASLPAGTVGTAYSATIAATSGTAPLSWSATGLPSPLSINSSTGVISGTPSAASSSSVTITVTDANSIQASHGYTLTINAAGGLTAPTNLVATAKGPTQINLTWSAATNHGYGYVVEVESSGDSRYSTWTQLQPIPTASGYTCAATNPLIGSDFNSFHSSPYTFAPGYDMLYLTVGGTTYPVQLTDGSQTVAQVVSTITAAAIPGLTASVSAGNTVELSGATVTILKMGAANVLGMCMSDPTGANVYNLPVNGVPYWVVEPQYVDPVDGTPAQFIFHGGLPGVSYSFQVLSFSGYSSPAYSSASNTAMATTNTPLATFYVSPTGNDGTGTGSSSAPWQTFLHASQQLSCGDLLYAEAGSYPSDTIYLTQNCTAANRIVVAPAPGATANITSSSGYNDTVFISGSYVVIDGIKSIAQIASTAELVDLDGNHNAILGGEFAASSVPLLQNGLYVGGSGAYNLIYGNYLHDGGLDPGDNDAEGDNGEIFALTYGANNNVIWSNHLTRGGHDDSTDIGGGYNKWLNNIMDGGWGACIDSDYYNGYPGYNLIEGNFCYHTAYMATYYKSSIDIGAGHNTIRRNQVIGGQVGMEETDLYGGNEQYNLVYNNTFYMTWPGGYPSKYSDCLFQSDYRSDYTPPTYGWSVFANNICYPLTGSGNAGFSGTPVVLTGMSDPTQTITHNDFLFVASPTFTNDILTGGTNELSQAIITYDAEGDSAALSTQTTPYADCLPGNPCANPVSVASADTAGSMTSGNYNPPFSNNSGYTVTPNFVNAAGYDFHLTSAGSVLNGGGASISDPLYGSPIGTLDIGAFGIPSVSLAVRPAHAGSFTAAGSVLH